MFADFIDDLFTSVTDVAIRVAPTLLPAAAAFGAVKLAGGTTQEAFVGAGVAAGVSGLMGSAGGGSTAAGAQRSGATIAPGGSTPAADGAAKGGTLDRAGIASGEISGDATLPDPGAMLPQQQQPRGLLSSLGITGGDLLKAGGQIVASLDDTDDEFRARQLDLNQRQLDLLERRHTVTPVAWAPRTPLMSRVTARGPGARRF